MTYFKWFISRRDARAATSSGEVPVPLNRRIGASPVAKATFGFEHEVADSRHETTRAHDLQVRVRLLLEEKFIASGQETLLLLSFELGDFRPRLLLKLRLELSIVRIVGKQLQAFFFRGQCKFFLPCSYVSIA